MEVEYSRDGAVALDPPQPAGAAQRRHRRADRAARRRARPRRRRGRPGRGAGRPRPRVLRRPRPQGARAASRPRCRPGCGSRRIQEVTRLTRRFPGPVVAAVHGYALGAGCEFALACDVVVATEDAQFGFPEVGVGLSVTGGISRLLPMLVGWAKAKELLLLGDRVTGAEAAQIGLVARAVPAGRARGGGARAGPAVRRAAAARAEPGQAGARPRPRRDAGGGDGARGRPRRS